MKTLFITAGSTTAVLVTRRGRSRTKKELWFENPHAALDWCLGHGSGFVLMPDAAGARPGDPEGRAARLRVLWGELGSQAMVFRGWTLDRRIKQGMWFETPGAALEWVVDQSVGFVLVPKSAKGRG